MIGAAAIRGEIPIIPIRKTLGVAVEEIEVRACAVEIGVDIVLLRAGGPLSIVEQINHTRRIWH